MITAILLAAGYGTRLYPLTKDTPKALLPVGEGVILDQIMRSLETVQGLVKRILVTNHTFVGQFRNWQRAQKAQVQILDDGTTSPEMRLGAIRDLELARTQGAAQGDLLVVGTDNLFRWPLGGFVARAATHRPAPSVALWQAPSPGAATQFGVVELDDTGRITRFVEKSPQPPSTAVALCVYYFPSPMVGAIPQYLDERRHTDAPGYFVEWLVSRGAVYGIRIPGAWYDIGTPETYQQVLNTWREIKHGTRLTSTGGSAVDPGCRG